MSGRRSLITDQLTIMIMCFMTVVPLVWLVETYAVVNISMEYFLSYYIVLMSVYILLGVINKEKMIYNVSILMPVVIIVVFRDVELFLNSFMAFFLFFILLMAYKSSKRREVMAVNTIIIGLLCGYKGGMPRVAAVMLIGLIALSAAGFMTKQTKYAVTSIVIIECLVLLINVDVSPLLWKPLAKGIDKVWGVVDSAFKDTEFRFGAFNNVSYTGYGEPGGMFKGVDYRYREELSVDVVGKITMIYLKGASYANVTKDGISKGF